MAVPALKNVKEVGGGGDLTYFFNLKVYRTNFMQFFCDNFCRLLGLCEEKSPQSPLGASINFDHLI